MHSIDGRIYGGKFDFDFHSYYIVPVFPGDFLSFYFLSCKRDFCEKKSFSGF
jgi:hypothetical protein